MFRRCMAGFLIMLNAAFIPAQNANALKATTREQVEKTNVFGNDSTYAKNLYASRDIALVLAANKSFLANQNDPPGTALLPEHSTRSFTVADASPQNTPAPGTTQKAKLKPRVRLKVVIIVIVVLVGVAIAIGLADKKS